MQRTKRWGDKWSHCWRTWKGWKGLVLLMFLIRLTNMVNEFMENIIVINYISTWDEITMQMDNDLTKHQPKEIHQNFWNQITIHITQVNRLKFIESVCVQKSIILFNIHNGITIFIGGKIRRCLVQNKLLKYLNALKLKVS